MAFLLKLFLQLIEFLLLCELVIVADYISIIVLVEDAVYAMKLTAFLSSSHTRS